MSRTKNKNSLTKMAAIGFVIGSTLSPGTGQAYYGGSSYILSTVTTTAGALTTTGAIVGGILLTLKTTDLYPDGVVQQGDTTRRLLDAAMLVTRSELAMHLELLHSSPTAYTQFSQELMAGQGPAVEAMVRATNLPVATLQADWLAVQSEADARHTLDAFVHQMAPKLTVSDTVAADLAWQLVREQSAAAEGPVHAMAHLWLAAWLGISAESVEAANRQALVQLGVEGDEALRAQLYSDPEPYLRALSVNLELSDMEAIKAHFEALLAQSTTANTQSVHTL